MQKTTERFEKAYDALVQAFFKGTLGKGDCSACAVGNIVAAANGIDLKINKTYGICESSGDNYSWGILFATSDGRQECRTSAMVHTTGIFDPSDPNDIKQALSILEPTGYSEEELAQVEYVFETNAQINLSRYRYCNQEEIIQDQYNGLCAVVDVLLRLDNLDNDGYKEKFREHPALQKA